MKSPYYILENKKAKPVDSVLEWAKMFEKIEERIVNKTTVGEVSVSTVFLGIDHGFNGVPMLFETMIFGGEHDQYQDRCETWEQAELMHQKACILAFAQ